ncbi:MAG: hypothetical protein KC466_05540, partial [Myxococcales bacterium]|nr:hypothetical protein [Myxococcales bacterium]
WAHARFALGRFEDLDRALRVVVFVRLLALHPVLGIGLLTLRDWARRLQIFFFCFFLVVLLILGQQTVGTAGAFGPMLVVLGGAFVVCAGFIRALTRPEVRARFRRAGSSGETKART